MLVASVLDNTPAFVAPKAFSHQETPTQQGVAYGFHPHLSLLV